MAEQLANNAVTALNGAINASVTSITVDSVALFPTGGDFRIRIDDEIMKVTGVSGSSFTVVRGQEGTTGASHNDDAVVTAIITKEALTAFRADYQLFNTMANRPAAGIAGRTFVATDFPLQYYDNGSAWIGHLPGHIPFTTPVDSGFSWVNQGSSTFSSTHGTLILNSPTNGNATNYRMRVKSFTAPRTLTVCFLPSFQSSNAGGCGILVRRSTTSKFSTFLYWAGAGSNESARIICEHWNNETSFSGSVFNRNATAASPGSPVWFQIQDNNTDIILRHSKDGYKWMQFTSFGRTSFEASAYNQWGVFTQPHDQEVDMRILSWKEE